MSISFCFPIFPHRSLYLPGTILNGASFLNDVERVATTEYEPSDDDIVRARLRTMGVQEHRFLFERGTSSSSPSPSASSSPAFALVPASSPAHPKPTLTSTALSLLGAESGHEWLMYDVGGTRSLRAAWAPFFDDVNAIIFLAPISAFDEKLAENPRVNRLEDSFLLWKAVVANKLLCKTQVNIPFGFRFLKRCTDLSVRWGDSIDHLVLKQMRPPGTQTRRRPAREGLRPQLRGQAERGRRRCEMCVRFPLFSLQFCFYGHTSSQLAIADLSPCLLHHFLSA